MRGRAAGRILSIHAGLVSDALSRDAGMYIYLEEQCKDHAHMHARMHAHARAPTHPGARMGR
jgi:hypothetical protein